MGHSPLLPQLQHCRPVHLVQNRRHGIKARRGDGSFGEIVPNVPAIADAGFAVKRGPIATIEIGIINGYPMRQGIAVINEILTASPIRFGLEITTRRSRRLPQSYGIRRIGSAWS